MEKLELIKIKHWTFDPLKKTLTSEDSEGKIVNEALEAKHADLLQCLINLQDDIITRDRLIEVVWKSRYVDDRTINATISRLRKILGGTKDEFIKTHPKLGYSFPPMVEYISRPTPEKVRGANHEKLQLKYYKYLIVASVCLFSFLVWFTLENVNDAQTTLSKEDVHIEPLTYEEGWEFEPSLSFDGKYLAYTTTSDPSNFLTLKIKNLETGETIPFHNNFYSRSPTWSPVNNDIFYAIEREGECVIEKSTMYDSLKFDKPLLITSCGSEILSPAISISSDSLWMYFSYKDYNFPSIVKRINLESMEIETLTSPPDFANDFEVRVNSDNTKLAFVRFYEDHQSKVFVLDLKTRQITPVTHDYQQPFYISWLPAQNQLAIVDFTNNTLNISHSDLVENYPIFQHKEQIESPIFRNGEIILAMGDSYNSEIVKASVDNNLNNINVVPFIKSSFKDHEIQLTNIEGKRTVYFVSNRSGGFQIWQKIENKYIQLTKFQNKFVEITNLKLSIDNKKLLFKLNKKLHVLDLVSLDVLPISAPSTHLGNATWSCEKPDTILITAAVHKIWGLYSIDINSGLASLNEKNVIAIKSLCKSNKYAIAKENTLGLFLTKSTSIQEKANHIKQSHNFSNTSYWDIDDKHLVFYDRELGELQLTELLRFTQKHYEIDKYIVHRPKLIENEIFFNGLTVKNTFIGKIPMPKTN